MTAQLTFRGWLALQVDRRDPIGQLARDHRRCRYSDWPTFLAHLTDAHDNVEPAGWAAARSAGRIYQRATAPRRPRKRQSPTLGAGLHQATEPKRPAPRGPVLPRTVVYRPTGDGWRCPDCARWWRTLTVCPAPGCPSNRSRGGGARGA